MRLSILSILLAMLLGISTLPAHAKEQNLDTMREDIKTATQPQFIKYDLAFPGMLPDHPLYKLKVLRDKISAALISDPRKKIEFRLKQTDKGILASAMLAEKGKIDLATQTALKAEHNFTILSQEVDNHQEVLDDALLELLEVAALKHQEVLLSLAQRVPEDKRKTFLTVADFSKTNMQFIKQSVKTYRQPIPSGKDLNQNQ